MPRDLPVGNEHYLVMFDRKYQIADVFYPHVGMENHSLGHSFRFGVFVDGKFSWTSEWTKTMGYIEDTLATEVALENSDLGLKLHCTDCVDFVSPIFIRTVKISNMTAQAREARIFFHHDFHLKSTNIGDTAYYDAHKSRALIHYKADSYFLMNCLNESGEGIYQYACGFKESAGALGTWKDAEDGYLSMSPIAQGSVDSVFSARVDLTASGESSVYYWMVAGKTYDEVQSRDSFVKTRMPQNLIQRTVDFWRLWSSKDSNSSDLSGQVWNLYKRSLLVVKSQSDGDGAVIAANDSDILQFNKDTYSYMWPRDSSFVTMAMSDSGYTVMARSFFEFCSKIIFPTGWFFHKYQPDGSAGSSWHPWIVANTPQLPIQEDETALVIISLWNHFARYREVDFVKPFYKPIVKNAGNFLMQYRDSTTKLPLESYDLWEERRGVFTYTSSAVYGGLIAAANFASSFGENQVASSFSDAAAEIKDAIEKYLFDASLGRFLRGCALDNGKAVNPDGAIDASLAGLFLFGVLPAEDSRVEGTMKQIEDKLTVRTSVGGVARYEGDKYQALENYDSKIPGNPWFVCTLWLADWYIAIAKQRTDLGRAREILDWCVSHTLPSGIMAEQLNPYDGSPISVSPLTWSHGTLVDSVNRYLRKFAELKQ
ncbi:MAG: glycoside hydrolase family 15 protein [Nitrososphaerales archaeon]